MEAEKRNTAATPAVASEIPTVAYRASLLTAFATGYAGAAVDSALIVKAQVPPEELR